MVHTWTTVLLQWSALLLCVAYLVSTSVGGLAPVASRVIRWASARHKPALSIVVMARLDWTGRRQTQQLWVGTQVLACRQSLRPHPATSYVHLIIWGLERVLFQDNMLPEEQNYLKEVI